MSSNTASSPVAKAPKAKASKSSTTKKTVVKKSNTKTTVTAHPSWRTIVAECITVSKDDARTGVSRQLLKKYALEKYKLLSTPANIARLNHAIMYGAEKGIFLLPKGPSGRVKLSAAGKAGRSNENTVPAPKSSKLTPTKAVKPAKSTVKSPKSTKAAKPSTKPTTVKKTSSAKVPKKITVAKSAKAKSTSASKAKSKTTKVKA